MSDLMCPILTAATLKSKAPTSLIHGPLGTTPDKLPAEESEAIPCIGSACAWWQSVADEKGVTKGGNCAVQMIPLALSQITGGFQNMVGLVAQRLPVIPSKK